MQVFQASTLTVRARRAGKLVRQRPLLALAAGVLVVMPLCVLLAWGAGRVWRHGEVLPGVWINEFVASGLERPQLERDLALLAQRLNERPVRVSLEGLVFRFDPKQIGAKVDVRSTASEVLSAGREHGLLAELSWWVARFFSSHRVAPRVEYDTKKLEQLITEWEQAAISDPPAPGEIRSQGGRLVMEEPRVGRRIDRQRLRHELPHVLGRSVQRSLELGTERVKPALNKQHVQEALQRAQHIVRAPVQLVSLDGKLVVNLTRSELVGAIRSRARPNPARLEIVFDADAVAAAIAPDKQRLETEPKNASFRVDKNDRVSIVPGRPGIRLDSAAVAEALMHAVLAKEHVGELPVDRDARPSFTTEDARALNIMELVGRFSTRHACCQPRVQNIHRIADLLDGTLVKPGEVFSVNEKVGPRTTANGFVPAPTIVEGDMEDTVGGGVSQFATTLFNALLHAGYDIIERQPHSYWFPRYPMGHEATLSYPKPDIIFKNDTASGLLIETDYTDTRITVKLFGNKEGRKVKTTVSGRQDIIDPPVELVPDRSMEPDEEKTLEAGMIGWSVIAGRTITFKDNTQKVEKRKVTYMPRVRRVRVHPCRIPEGEDGHTGEDCPEPEDAEIEDPEARSDQASEAGPVVEPSVLDEP